MITFHHPSGIIEAEIDLPSSKSISNRLLALRHLYSPSLEITRLSNANDTYLMQKALSGADTIDVEDAGTVLRFMLAICACTPGDHKIVGSRRLGERPITRLIEVLEDLGAEITRVGSGFPIEIKGAQLRAERAIDLRNVESSQFVSAILLIIPKVRGVQEILWDANMHSASYVRMTIGLMTQCGFRFEIGDSTIRFLGKELNDVSSLKVEADLSSAFYWISLLAASREGSVVLKGLVNSEIQAESEVLSQIANSGLKIDFTNDGLWVEKKKEHGVTGKRIGISRILLISLLRSQFCSH